MKVMVITCRLNNHKNLSKSVPDKQSASYNTNIKGLQFGFRTHIAFEIFSIIVKCNLSLNLYNPLERIKKPEIFSSMFAFLFLLLFSNIIMFILSYGSCLHLKRMFFH